MDFSIRNKSDQFVLDISWNHIDMTIGFVSVFEDETGDIEFQDTDFETARINQASSENIGIFLLKKNEFVFEARGNYNELIRSLAQQTDFQRYDTPNN